VHQIDLVHIHAVPESDHVEQGIDLTEYYINVEWDILRNVSQSARTVLFRGVTVMWLKSVNSKCVVLMHEPVVVEKSVL
jgi:hypothetical protein